MTNLAVSVGSAIANFLRSPSSADSVGTFPSGKVFGCPKRRTHNQNHPTFDHKLGWIFYKFCAFAAVGAVRMSPAEAVLSAMKLPKKGGAWLSGEAA